MCYAHTMLEIAMLFIVGFAAGVINAVAGGGMLLVFPLLMGFRVPAATANITCNLVLFPGAAATIFGYRSQIKQIEWRYYILLVPCYIGAILGAALLARTSNDQFKTLMPWLLLCAVLFFILQPYVRHFSRAQRSPHLILTYIFIGVILLVGSIYGGYFGAGFGFLFMALAGLMGVGSMNHLAVLKNFAGGGIELIALVYFIFNGIIAWHYGVPAMIGCCIGGLLAARFALQLPHTILRLLVIAIGLVLVIAIFVRQYLLS
jgi:uncharacterized protein